MRNNEIYRTVYELFTLYTCNVDSSKQIKSSTADL